MHVDIFSYLLHTKYCTYIFSILDMHGCRESHINHNLTHKFVLPDAGGRTHDLESLTSNWSALMPRATEDTSTVYWCIASKLKAPRNFYWMSNMFLWVEIFLFFVCYHVVPKRHSQLDYELNGLLNKMKLKTTRWRWCFLKIFTMTVSLESFDQLV